MAAMAADVWVTTSVWTASPLAPRALPGIETEPPEPEEGCAKDGKGRL